MNSKYIIEDDKVIVYDERNNKTTRIIYNNVEDLLQQENIVEALKINKKIGQENILLSQQVHKVEIETFKKIQVMLGGSTAILMLILYIFSFNTVMLILIAPLLVLALVGLPVNLFISISDSLAYKKEIRKSLQKQEFYEDRYKKELQKLEEIKNTLDDRIHYFTANKEQDLYYKDTIWRIERDANLYSHNISRPKKLIKSKRKNIPTLSNK